MCGPAEGNVLLATQEIAMEKNFGDREPNTPSIRSEDLTTKLVALELTETDLGHVSGGMPTSITMDRIVFRLAAGL
jgi:hypothetical protein